MPTQRESVAAFKAALEGVGATEIRMPLTTDQAIALAKELAPKDLRHADLAVAAISRYEKVRAIEEPKDLEARLKWSADVAGAAKDFWEAFEGQSVGGVEIIRRRA